MESLDSLKAQLRRAQDELDYITIRQGKTSPWAPGVYDSFESYSYTDVRYTDSSKAEMLKSKIARLQREIDTYALRAREERERAEAEGRFGTKKYSYIVDGKRETTKNPAIAARYGAQHRFFGMSKLQQTLAKLTGQKRKFDKLWFDADTPDVATQERVAAELNKLFR